jgi:hypothetical protein
MNGTDPTLELRGQVVLLLRRFSDLGGFDAAPEDRGPIFDALYADATEAAPDDGPER